MTALTTLEGPVEMIDGVLSLRIPRTLAEPDLVASLHGTGQIDEMSLTVRLPDAVAVDLGLTPGSRVAVDNRGGNFSIAPARILASIGWHISSRRHAPLFTLGSWALFGTHGDHS